MSMIPYHHQTGMMILGICKHVLVSFDRERPLQLRLRMISIFVTKFVKINTILYLFWWVLLVLEYIFLFFSSPWLFSKVILNIVKNLRRIMSFWGFSRRIFSISYPSFWASAKNLFRILPVILSVSEESLVHCKQPLHHFVVPLSSQRGKTLFKIFSPVRGSVTKWRGGC